MYVLYKTKLHGTHPSYKRIALAYTTFDGYILNYVIYQGTILMWTFYSENKIEFIELKNSLEKKRDIFHYLGATT